MKANIHSFLVADNRIAVVCKFLDEAIAELDNMDSLVSSYKIHLNVSESATDAPSASHAVLFRLPVTTSPTSNPRIGVFRCKPKTNARF
jgi:hypothetical protein